MKYAESLEELEAMMKATQQTQGMDVLEHGYRVHEAFKKLDANSCPLYTELVGKLVDAETLKRYHVYHDCGKPLCADGTGRFPDHARISAAQWSTLFPEDMTVAYLMSKDMDFHTARAGDYATLWQHPLAPTLYLTAWAEIYANAEMFGGVESDSFKIKRKRLIQAAKKFAKEVDKHEVSK